jgi:RarD protein
MKNIIVEFGRDKMKQNSNKKLGYTFIILAMLIWGSIGIFARLIPQPSIIIVFYRVLFAFISLLLILFYKNNFKIEFKETSKTFLILTGIMLALNWLFYFKAVKTTTIANATLSYYTSPIILTLFSIIFLKEKLTKKGVLALFLGFVGIFIMLVSSGELATTRIQGIGYGLIAAVCYAVFALNNKLIDNISASHLTFLQTGIATIIFLPFVLNKQLPHMDSLFLLLIMGIVHTAIGLILYIKGLKISKVQEVGALSYLDPVSAILFALLIFGETPQVSTMVGGSLILIGSYITVSK